MPKFNDTTIYGNLTITGTISGNIATKTVSGLMSAADKDRLDGIDWDTIMYMNYASDIYYRGGYHSLFSNAWKSSLLVDPLEISANSSPSTQRGILQYPNGETEGVIIPQGVTSIGDYVFFNWTPNNQPLVIPNSVTSIGEGAFGNWRANNQPLVIPNSVTSIGEYAFGDWTSNNQPLVIPDSVTSIGNLAFTIWESNNQPLVIPNSVTSIGDNAFNGWSLVPYVEMKGTTPPTLENANAFRNQNNAPIYVPDAKVTEYKTATNWVSLADRIFPISNKTSGGGGGIPEAPIDNKLYGRKNAAWSNMENVIRQVSFSSGTMVIEVI